MTLYPRHFPWLFLGYLASFAFAFYMTVGQCIY